MTEFALAFPGMRRFSSPDNNGNRLEFLSPLAPAEQRQ
jgi:hypothetical protein